MYFSYHLLLYTKATNVTVAYEVTNKIREQKRTHSKLWEKGVRQTIAELEGSDERSEGGDTALQMLTF